LSGYGISSNETAMDTDHFCTIKTYDPTVTRLEEEIQRELDKKDLI
jgi:hypothetical protein